MSQNRYTAVFAAVAITVVQGALFAATTQGPDAAPQGYASQVHAAAKAPLELVHAAATAFARTIA